MKRYLFLMLECIAIYAQSQAQTLTGKVIDESNQPLEFANIVLLSLPDSTFIQGTISDQTGIFTLPTNGQSGLLRISSIGYANVYKVCKESGDLGVILLHSDTQLLGEVVIKGDLPRTRIKGDAMVTNVEGTILEKAGTAENLLDKIPNVSAADGAVKVFGRGAAEVYINGRKMRDASELDQLSADNIKAVGVINNPGARYDASVKAVVRISTKKALGDGFGFNNRTYVSYDERWSALEQFNFNYRTGNFDLGGMLYGQQFHGWEGRTLQQDTYLDKHWEQVSPLHRNNNNKYLSGQLSLNYTLNPEHAIGMRYNYERSPKHASMMDLTTTVRQDGILTETSANHVRYPAQSSKHDVNVYYTGKVGDWGIDFNADGMWGNADEDQQAEESVTTSNGPSETSTLTTFNHTTSDLYAAKLIVDHPLLGGNISLGSEYSYAKRTNIYTNPEKIIRDDDSQIKEGSTSAFLEYSRAFGKVNLQVGIRYEHVKFDYYEEDKYMDEQSRSYNNVFPSVALSFPVGKVQMQLSYARDVTRPSYNMLNSNIIYGNRYTYQTGNSSLLPTLTDNINLSAVYRWIQLQAGYQHIKDASIMISEAYEEDNPSIALIRIINAAAYNQCFASLTLSPTIGIWTPQFRAQFTKQWFKADTPQGYRSLNTPYMNFIWQNTLQLPAGFLLDVELDWNTKGYMQNMYFHRHLWGVDLALQKSFLSDRLSFRLDVYDLFKKWERGNSVIIYSGALRSMKQDEYSHRVIRLTARYKFNSGKSKYRGTGAGEEQKRRM